MNYYLAMNTHYYTAGALHAAADAGLIKEALSEWLKAPLLFGGILGGTGLLQGALDPDKDALGLGARGALIGAGAGLGAHALRATTLNLAKKVAPDVSNITAELTAFLPSLAGAIGGMELGELASKKLDLPEDE